MRLVGPSLFAVACAALASSSACGRPSEPGTPTAAFASASTTATPPASAATTTASTVAHPGPLPRFVLPAGLFLVAEAPTTGSFGVFRAPNDDALLVAYDLPLATRRSRGAIVHGDTVTIAPVIDGMLAALPERLAQGDLADAQVLPDGGALGLIDAREGGSRCHGLRRGPRDAEWLSLGAGVGHRDGCGPLAVAGDSAVDVSWLRPGEPASLLALGGAPRPSLRQLAPAPDKRPPPCEAWTSRLLSVAVFPGGEAITVGVPCEAPSIRLERFGPGATRSQTAAFPDLMLDQPAEITIVSATRVEVRRATASVVGQPTLVDVRLDYVNGAWRESKRHVASPPPVAPMVKQADQTYDRGGSWSVGDDAYVLFVPADPSTKLPQLLARARPVRTPVDLRTK